MSTLYFEAIKDTLYTDGLSHPGRRGVTSTLQQVGSLI